MKLYFSLLISCILFVCFFSAIFAEDLYVGEDLGNDIYKRLDEGISSLKKQLISNRLRGSADRINTWVGDVCSSKEGGKTLCFQSGMDFTASELDEISAGSITPIYTHMNPSNNGVDTERVARIRGIILEHYNDLQSQVYNEQKKLQSVGSIGLFSDGNKDNSSYDLMVDLENIHSVLFAKDIPYNGTDNMGAKSVANLLGNAYNHPFLPIVPLDLLTLSPSKDPGVSLIQPTANPLTLSGMLSNGPGCPIPEALPKNLDPDFLRDVQSQLLVGVNPNTSIAFSDNGKLPENWAKVAQGKGIGGLPGGMGVGTDKFPCSGLDFFCILVSMTDYTQNILGGGKASTIEYILDENLKIANKFAVSSFTQAKMTRNFFQLSLKNLDLPSMAHIGTVVTRLPPPLLNFKPGTTGGSAPPGGNNTAGEEDELNKIIVNTFEELGLDFKRQNSLEKNNESRMVNNLTHLTTDSTIPKSDTDVTPQKSGYIQTKETDLKKSYGDSFNDDLFELHDFTLAFSKSIETTCSVIKKMHAIPQK